MNYFIHPTAIVEKNVEIGEGTKIWANSHIMSGAKLGKNCVIGENVHIGREVVLGDHCKVQNGVNLYTGVTAEDYVFFGPACQTTNELHIGLLDVNDSPIKNWILGYTHFKRGSAVGANATIICGTKENPTTIGKHAKIGSGAVVTKSVKDYTTVVGNPAREIVK